MVGLLILLKLVDHFFLLFILSFLLFASDIFDVKLNLLDNL